MPSRWQFSRKKKTNKCSFTRPCRVNSAKPSSRLSKCRVLKSKRRTSKTRLNSRARNLMQQRKKTTSIELQLTISRRSLTKLRRMQPDLDPPTMNNILKVAQASKHVQVPRKVRVDRVARQTTSRTYRCLVSRSKMVRVVTMAGSHQHTTTRRCSTRSSFLKTCSSTRSTSFKLIGCASKERICFQGCLGCNAKKEHSTRWFTRCARHSRLTRATSVLNSIAQSKPRLKMLWRVSSL